MIICYINRAIFARFEVLTAVLMMISVFYNVTQCGLVCTYVEAPPIRRSMLFS